LCWARLSCAKMAKLIEMLFGESSLGWVQGIFY